VGIGFLCPFDEFLESFDFLRSQLSIILESLQIPK
jgi:hypothetical protein